MLYFTGRNRTAADAVITKVKDAAPAAKLIFVEADFTSFASVKKAAKDLVAKVASDGGQLDGLLCNAGIMATDPAVTEDGYEKQFAVNHLAHALLIHECLPLLQKTSGSRIVFVSSLAQRLLTSSVGISYDDIKTPQASRYFGLGARWIAYGQSKLANLMYARALAKRYPSITCVAIHPGVIETGLANGLGFFNSLFVRITTTGQRIPIPDGAKSQLWALTAPTDASAGPKSGGYYGPVAESSPESPLASSESEADKLWAFTQDVISAS